MAKKKTKGSRGSLVIQTPEEEYKTFVEQKIEDAVRIEDEGKVALYREALDLGIKILTRVKE